MFKNPVNGKYLASGQNGGNLLFKDKLKLISRPSIYLNFKNTKNNILFDDSLLYLNNELLPKYKIKSKCKWYEMFKINTRRDKSDKIKIARFDESLHILYLFDPLTFKYFKLTQNKNESNIKCQKLDGNK